MKKMQHDSSTIAWNALGDEWFELAQTGESRNYFIMPNMLKYIGDVEGKKILDLGCGEGGYSRELSKRGAQVVSIDCSEKAIEYARSLAKKDNLQIEHHVRNSNDLFDIESEQFDIVLCSMMLMDCEDFEGTLREVVRILKSNGRLFASVLHPCFDGNHESGIGRQGTGIDRQVVIMNYFEPKEWEAPLWKGTIPVIWRHRTLEDYVKTFIKVGLTIVDMNEPQATDEQAKISVALAWLKKIPLFLYWELKK
ncbi:MAG: class I SAM-dependent methyltransferase [Eubacterium sp.]|nr:class I SAM-dependent methyltransferase [Eubacterium sp.]